MLPQILQSPGQCPPYHVLGVRGADPEFWEEWGGLSLAGLGLGLGGSESWG